MFHPARRPAVAGIATAALLMFLALAPVVTAHAAFTAGAYSIEVGWVIEPTYVSQPNAVQFTIHDKDDKPVTDLGADDIKVVVSTAGTASPSLGFDPAFDLADGAGPMGEYHASIVPTAVGDYTFHITGSIHGTTVDITATSGSDTFNSVVGSTDIEFPVKQPSLGEVATHLDRIDARITTLQSADPGTAALTAANSAVEAAHAAADAADRALLVGSLVGGVGLVLGVFALAIALRAARRGAGTA